MLATTISAFTALLSLSAALPTTHTPRAGGPIPEPIPGNCSVTCAAPTYPTDGFKVTDAFTSAHSVFNDYIPTDSVYNVSQSYNMCLQQCYGFGYKGTCVSTLFASNVTYTAYGVTTQGYACLMFGAPLTGADLETTTDGSYAGARGTNIGCPAS